MSNEYKKISLCLDGKQTVSIPIDIKYQNGRYIEEPLTVFVRGFLKFDESSPTNSATNKLEDKTVLYPVLFTSDSVSVNNGRCVITLLPRAEDLFEQTQDIINETSVSNDDIISGGGISPDEQITDPSKEPVVIKIVSGEIRSPYKLSIEVTVTSESGLYQRTVDRGTNPQVEDVNDVYSLFQKRKKQASSNIIIDCYNNSDWVPSIDTIFGTNSTSKEDIIQEIENMKRSTPFGISTMYDAVISSARILSSDDVRDDRKIIYLFTDNECNVSTASIDNAVEEVNDLNGEKETPILISNLSIVHPETLSVKSNRSDTKNINKLAFLTGGQAVTIASESYLDEVSNILYRQAVGSMGYGTYEFIYDLGEESIINNIQANFSVFGENENGNWKIETSLDGYNFTDVEEKYDYAESVDFDNLHARYIKFIIVLITSISSDSPSVEDPSAPIDSPFLQSIRIVYNSYKVAYLYLNKQTADATPYQTTFAVDSNEESGNSIEIGLANSDSNSWDDYSTGSKPSVSQNGKVVVPIRFSSDIEEFQQEPLKKIDLFSLKTEYGSWDPYSSVLIYNKNDEMISSSYYKAYPREGIVVFNYALPTSYEDGDYKIGIINSAEYKVGLKLTNRTKDRNLEVHGIGYIYTSGKDLLPPLSKSSPEARNIIITNESPNRFSLIEASYIYYDSNFDSEDISSRRIKWFINGNYVKYLDNLIQWNDLHNPLDPLFKNTSLTYPNLEEGETIEDWASKQSDSIISAGDNIYFEIQVSDGNLYSSKERSNMVSVAESVPVLDQIYVRSEDANGNIGTRLSADLKAVIYPSLDEAFYADSDVNKSEIIWYVNNEVFKRGIYGDIPFPGQPPIHEIWPNELGSADNKDYGLRINNTIFVQVIPKTGQKAGVPITSIPTTGSVVQNSLPKVFDVQYTSNIDGSTNLVLMWKFSDFEIDQLGDVDTTVQTDRTGIKWYRKKPESKSQFELVYTYEYDSENRSMKETFATDVQDDYGGHITTNLGTHTSIIDKNIFSRGQQWYASIIPNDSYDVGETVDSSVITIRTS